jgi:hypothetical protein
MANFAENSDTIRQSILESGISSLKSRIRNMDIETVAESNCNTKKKAKPKYTKQDIAEKAITTYKTNIKQQPEAEKEEPKANTIASRANIRALSNSLANIRNGGYAGPTTEFTPSANGDVNPGRPRSYAALTVAGTEMTLEEYEAYIAGKFDECWKGYRRKPGTVPGSKGSCVKEEAEQLMFDEATYPSDFVNPDGSRRAVAKNKRDRRDMRPQQDDQERDRYGRRKTVDESPVVDELKDKLLEMDDHSWQAIDTVMRKLARENDMTPKELHKQFKAESKGMIPDDWAKENALKEEAGFMPLDEAVAINKVGNVYDVSLMWKAHTRRLKFFWPEVGQPSQEDMQRAVNMFYPGGKLLSFYMSTLPGDNQVNFMVMVPPLKESVWLPEHAWEPMTDEESQAYDIICEEIGEPTSPPMLSEEFNGFELWVEDHDTGEEVTVRFTEGSLHDWFNKSKSKDGKPGWVQSDGSPCANEEGETKTPKCYSSARRASMSKKELKSADARKSRQDPGQQNKSGAAKPTMVRTFKDKDDYKKHPSGDGKSTKKEEFEYVEEGTDKKGKGSGSKDACYHKVKSRFKVWPSAYGSGALVKCRQAGAANWGNSKKNEEYIMEKGNMDGMTIGGGHKRSTESGAGLTQKGVEKYRRQNPGSKLKTAVTTPPSKLKAGSKAAKRRKSFCARSRGWTGERGKAARRRWNC